MDFKIPDTPEELLRTGKKNFDQFNKLIPYVFGITLILFVAWNSFYKVNTDEVGVIRRFGKYVRTTQPGLHWKVPVIEKLNLVAVRKVIKDEFGFRTLKGGVKTQFSSRQYPEESLMLTGDLNVLDVRWVVQYKIKDPVQVLFNVREPRETVRDMSETVMRQVIGDNSVSEVLNTRDEINTQHFSHLLFYGFFLILIGGPFLRGFLL